MNPTDKYFEFLKKLENETPDSIMTNLFDENWKDLLGKKRGTGANWSDLKPFDKVDPILLPILAKDPLVSACYLYYLIHSNDNKDDALNGEKVKNFLKMSLDTIKTDSWACYVLISIRFNFYKVAVFEKYRSEFEKIISKDCKASYYYALGDFYKENSVREGSIRPKDNGRFRLGEPVILNSGYWSYYYAKHILANRWNEAEDSISKETRKISNILFSALYAREFINGKWIEAEPNISTDGISSLHYAQTINKEFPEGENEISKDPQLSFDYSKLINKEFKLGENSISTNAKLSFLYARDILNGRFELGEPSIMTDPDLTLQYAVEVVRGKLPEDMHNAMIGKKLAA